MDDSAIVTSATALVIAVFLPLAMRWLENRNDVNKVLAKEKREDELSARVVRAVEEQTRKTVEQNKETAAALLSSNADRADTLKEILDTGKTTHSLVNSNMTVSITQARDMASIALTSLRRTEALAKRLGEPEDPEVAKTIAGMETKVAELNKELGERALAAKIVADMQLVQAKENSTMRQVGKE